MKGLPKIFVSLLYLGSIFFNVTINYLTAANLVRHGIPVHCKVSARSQFLVRFLSLCWITGGQTIQPLTKDLLPSTGIGLTHSKATGLNVHVTAPGYKSRKNMKINATGKDLNFH